MIILSADVTMWPEVVEFGIALAFILIFTWILFKARP